MHFGAGKSRDVLCRACRTTRRDTLVTTSATLTTRVQGRRHSVDWGGHVHLTFSRSLSWDWCKSRTQKTELVHASTTASWSSAMLEQARRDTHDKRDTRHVARGVLTYKPVPFFNKRHWHVVTCDNIKMLLLTPQIDQTTNLDCRLLYYLIR